MLEQNAISIPLIDEENEDEPIQISPATEQMIALIFEKERFSLNMIADIRQTRVG